MYFKKLEIVGFKSFLNKTKLKFEPGVTAIVGPNGCGKSNIVDSIKWVLGEQSAKSMRSSNMQDVIFNGTEQYEPLSFAEVSLTLSNEDKILPIDYDEVVISRRLYRSGESEYLLNKMPVRLADVRGLIMGTGIGTSAYSIVEQGRMDMILSSKPEERRYVFEEASGITRYKTKKREAILKLEHTQENLTRIGDIIREVERQINSIERQARKAERYKACYDELKALEIKTACKKYRELSGTDNTLGSEDTDLKSLILELDSRIKESNLEFLGLRERYAALMEELTSGENKIMRLTTDIDKNAHTIAVNTERTEELTKRIERLDWETEQETERREALRSRLEALEVRFSDAQLKRQGKDGELASFEEKIKSLNESLEKYRSDLKSGRERSMDIVADQTKAKNSSIKLNSDIQHALSRRRRLMLESDGVRQETEKSKEELAAAEDKLRNVKLELALAKDEFDSFNREYISKQEELARLSDERREKEKRLNGAKMRRQFLEKLLAEREGINESVKLVMKQVEAGDERFSGVRGILSELINIDENYGESVESILGDAAQGIVVESRAVADRIVKYLEEGSLGSVSFIILEEAEEILRCGASQPVAGENTFGDITGILSAGEPYRSAMRALLRHTYVASSTEAAQVIMEKSGDFDTRVIGERGEVFRKGLCRTRNYSSKEVIPFFGRREKIEELAAEERKEAMEMESLQGLISNIEGWVRASIEKKEKLETTLREKQGEFSDISSKKSAVTERFNSLSEELLLLDTEIEEEDENIRKFNEEKTRLDQVLAELEEENSGLTEQIETAQKGIQDSAHEREETYFKIADIKAELSALRKEEENFAENVEREKESSRRVEEEVEAKRREINENARRINELNEEIKKLGALNLDYSAVVEESSGEIARKKEAKEAMAKDISSMEEALRLKQAALEEAKNKTRDLDIRKKELEYRRNALAEKMLDTYKVNIAEIRAEADETTNWDELAGRMDELKAQLAKMGDVSLGAVEEHKELEQRFQFLTKQRDDLVTGRETLMKAIVKINRTTREMFMETFEKVKVQFNDYFRMLFNGGKADLVLEDESNVLECGIDIVVRPPGKKLHNIMQLSGGEKAMTAIALIFAIFKVNPSPFCILDEIDAPLDESNIVRFCSVLQEFLKTSQFVIVTHNRMTIQLADVLYGITMQEKGVSKIVSVRFADGWEKAGSDAEPVTAAA